MGYKSLIDLDKTVAIYMDRSEELVNLIYKCFINKITYIPVDISWPISRVYQVLGDSKVKKIITSEKYADLFPEMECLIVEKIDLDKELFCVQLDNDISYVLYTSGSTGTPKGVAVKYKSLINLIKGISEVIPFSSNDTIACLTSVSFDIFFVESVMAKYLGLKIVVANNEEQKNPKYMAKMISENNVTVLQMTPSRLQLLASYDSELSCLDKVKNIMIGGEAFPLGLLKTLQNKTKARIYNMYGPTETTVWSAISELTNKDKIDIGYPIRNTKIIIVDENNQIAKDGQVGEICIAGTGLAKGYIGRPELTKEKFTVIPSIGKSKIYRTGDYGRYLESGELECLGRIDNQIKINGYRVELEEIEAFVSGFDGISQAMAVLNESQNRKELVVYYIGKSNIDSKDIISYLENKIPSYMIPAHFYRVDQFNYTLNGKIDRKKTPTVIYKDDVVDEDIVLIDKDKQKIMDAIFLIIKKDDLKTISYNMNLSDIGCDSITYLGLIAQLEEEFDIIFDEKAMHNTTFQKVGDLVDYCYSLIA